MPAASAAIVFCKYGFIITAICESDVTRYGRNYENSKIKIKTDFARNAPGKGGVPGNLYAFFAFTICIQFFWAVFQISFRASYISKSHAMAESMPSSDIGKEAEVFSFSGVCSKDQGSG